MKKSTLCTSNISNMFECHSRKDYQILIIFSIDIFQKTGHQKIIQFLTSPNIMLLPYLWKTKLTMFV